jgi:hypothetical protein
MRLKPGQKVKVNRIPLPLSEPVAMPVEVPTPTAAEIVEAVQEIEPISNPEAEASKFTQSTEEVVNIPISVTKSDPQAWKKTLQPENLVYNATTSAVVKDLNGLHMDLQLVKGQKVTSAGRVTKDANTYVITQKHLSEGKYYGIPLEHLGVGQDPDAYIGPLVSNDRDALDDLYNLNLSMELKEAAKHFSPKEKLVNSLGKLYSAVIKLKFWKK